MSRRATIAKLVGEGVVIVVSVLVALSADAWWDSRVADARRDDHLAALRRDFEQMSLRAVESFGVAQAAVAGGTALVTAIGREEGSVVADSAATWLGRLLAYEVFSPSLGAYEAVVASGDLELFDDAGLKRELATFFGSFGDLRTSEQALRSIQHSLLVSPPFGRLIGVHRIVPSGELAIFDSPPTHLWSGADELLSGLTLLALAQDDVLEDYRFLRQRIRAIQELLGSSEVSGTAS